MKWKNYIVDYFVYRIYSGERINREEMFTANNKKSTIRVLLGCSFVIIGCMIGLWDYTLKHFKHEHSENQIYEKCEELTATTEPNIIEENLEINSGDNFISLLKSASYTPEQSLKVITALKKVFSPKDLRTDHQIIINYNKGTSGTQNKKNLLSLIIRISIDLEVIVKQDEHGNFSAEKIKKELQQETRIASGNINESLYVDAIKQGAHPKVLHQMIQAFSYDVDFQRGFQKGDKYTLLFDFQKDHETGQEKPGDLLYACLELQGVKTSIYRFAPKSSKAQYFKKNGEYVKKGLLRTPIDGARISSKFGKRKHPILGYTKMHKGMDFAAPRGTPIMAAGSGKIDRIGRRGAYGHYIRIKHNAKYSTAYAHMCRYAKGLRTGSYVRQGQVIGYVGATGRATGPHLHYELISNGRQINPEKIKMLPSSKLRGQDLQRFLVTKNKIEKQVQSSNHQ